MDYLSPEMVSRQPHDHRVDTWAAGVLLYEMLTGEPPFHARNAGESLDRILSADLKLPSSLPEGAASLIQRLLQAEPSITTTIITIIITTINNNNNNENNN
ncbi:unnamed protein product [Polarella glacialis]|uniref:Protein kinase domain-containing protein n=1 Tax=Polarella glacialis TaxID=89957 RepID=A0A813GJN1_POLGL|nr:unnamed protein product [Polarella glacialis]